MVAADDEPRASTKNEPSSMVRYSISGSAAHNRIQPLLNANWIDESNKEGCTVDFLWENAIRSSKVERDMARCYSHLPNGTSLLDSKWVLGRLLKEEDTTDPYLAVLETHCFIGATGFERFAETVNLPESDIVIPKVGFRDLMDVNNGDSSNDELAAKAMNSHPNWWVIKDVWANGAGGVWTVFGRNSPPPLIESHSYVAQKYAWPLVLYQNRKCHVRVYGLQTSDGRAFVHTNCFLHVANDAFDGHSQHDTVHITNCCANSHDICKFAGEICANLEADEHTTDDNGQPVIGLAPFFPSIKASVAALAKATFPFLRGGERNHGFEYLGLDFILSYRDNTTVAYLLEVNAPPSQDTATGLPHAERLHDTVLSDLLSLWVLPNIIDSAPVPGGWRCVYREEPEASDIEPSKAAILNKIRWTLFERGMSKRNESNDTGRSMNDKNSSRPGRQSDVGGGDKFASLVRAMFPYFQECNSTAQETGSPKVFFENAGGTQVPGQVIASVAASLSCRHREKAGVASVKAAKRTMKLMMGADEEDSIFLGPNATTLLSSLAQRYAKVLKLGDEIVVSIENHKANVEPWIEAAQEIGIFIRWWDPCADNRSPKSLVPLLSQNTRLVVVPHASNIFGCLESMGDLQRIVSKQTNGYGRLIVDGVAAAPHAFPDVHNLQVDWYVVSLHKMCGPHLGALYGRRSAVEELEKLSGPRPNLIQMGTLNYEACEGVVGLGKYYAWLAELATGEYPSKLPASSLTRSSVREAFQVIERVETALEQRIIAGLMRSPRVEIIGYDLRRNQRGLPVVAFVHQTLSSSRIIQICNENGVICRNGTFLSTEKFQDKYDIDSSKGVVRLSLLHYNLQSEIDYTIQVLESIPDWF